MAPHLPSSQEFCVHQLFEAQARRTPEATAVIFEGSSLSYAELDARANRLARHLVARGVGPERRVAVCVRPSLEGIVALFAVLKAGGAYVPVDPEAPFERLDFMFRDAGVAWVLTQQDVARSLPTGSHGVLCLDSQWEAVAAESAEPLPPCTGPLHLAYVIYTSGSTGEPKGVLVSHGSVVNHNLAVAEAFGLRPGDRVLQFTPLHFDAAGEEIYPPLLRGASIVVRGELVPTGEFRGLIERERLSVLSLPPAFLHEWLSELSRQGGRLPGCLRLVILGGEKLLPETWALWRQLGGKDIPWINVYGPTEATVTATMCPIRDGEGLPEVPTLPIGKPIANVRALLLDAGMRPVPAGEPGELFLGGAGLARGYLGRPEQTAERFVPDPFGDEPGARLYRTGDLVRLLPDGRMEFLGRVDQQVKIRGNRVEPGEIEAVLRQQPGVQEALVIPREDPPHALRLVAYVISPEAESFPPAERRAMVKRLREACVARLPDYMVPAALVVLPSLPLTANGKVDRKALPPPGTELEESTYVAPRNATEQALAEIWAETLGVPRVGIHDDFFALGGHSLAAMQVVSRVGERLFVEMDLRLLFDFPSIAGLSEALSSLLPPEAAAAQVEVEHLSQSEVDAMLRDLLSRQS